METQTPETNSIFWFLRFGTTVGLGLVSAFACTAINPAMPTDGEVFKQANSANQVELKKDPLTVDAVDVEQMLPGRTKDPCTATNAQEAWLALDAKRPQLGTLLSSEVYFASSGTKMLAVAQQKREIYGENQSKFYIEVSAEVAERGSRVGSFSQVIATRTNFAEAGELFVSLPPYWQQQVQDPQAVLSIKHHLLKDTSGFVKFENEIASDLSTRLEQGVELRCRSGEACHCL